MSEHALLALLIIPIAWLLIGLLGIVVLIKGKRSGTIKLRVGTAELSVSVGKDGKE